MFVQFLPFLYKSLVILAKALFCSSHPHLSSVITLIIYYMFELCVVYLFKSSLLGSTLLTCCLCLLRPALRPGSTGQWVSGVVLSRHFGPSSRILAGPVSSKIDLSYCDLSSVLYHFMSILFLFLSFLSSVCSVVLCAVSGPRSASGTGISYSNKSSALETPPGAVQSNHDFWITKSSRSEPPLEAVQLMNFSWMSKSSPREAAQGCIYRWVTLSNPAFLIYDQTGGYYTQVLKIEATKPSFQGAFHSNSTIKSSVHGATQLNPLHQRNYSIYTQPYSTDHRRRLPADLATSNSASCISTTNIQALDLLKALPAFTSANDVDRPLSTPSQPTNIFLQSSVAEGLCQEERKSATTFFMNSLSATRESGGRLLYSTSIQHDLTNFCSELAAIHPILSIKLTTNRVSHSLDLLSFCTSLRIQWQTANSPFGSRLNSYLRVLTNLAAESSTTDDESDTHPTVDSTSVSSTLTSCYLLGNDYTSTLAVPNLTGDILNRTRRLHCLKESNNHPFLLKQRSHAYSVFAASFTLLNSECAIFKPERHSSHFCPRKQNHSINQRRSFISSSNLRFDPEGATTPTHANSIFSQPQQGLYLLHDYLHRPTFVQPATLNIHSQQFSLFDYYHHLLNLQLAAIIVNFPGRINIFLGSNFWLQCQKEFFIILVSASEHGDQHITPGYVDTGTAYIREPLQQSNSTHHVLSDSSLNHSIKLTSVLCPVEPAVDFVLPLSPAELQLEQQHFSQFIYFDLLSFLISHCRQQTTLSEKSDCQPPGECYNQAVLPTLALFQQPWKMNQNPHSPRKDALLCLSSTHLLKLPTLTGFDSVSPEPHNFSESSLQKYEAVVHLRTTTKENRTPAFLATSKPSNATFLPNAEQSTFCASTEFTSLQLLPLTCWRDKPLLAFLPFSCWRDEPPLLLLPSWRKELPPPLLSEYSEPTFYQPPQKEQLELINVTTFKQPLQKKLLKHSHPVDFSTTISTMAFDCGTLSLIHFCVSFHADWCWQFCSTFIYDGVLLSAATSCVTLMVSNRQPPADSSMSTLSGAERKSAESWLIQAKIYILNSEKTATTIKRKHFSKSIRLQPWHPLHILDQTLTAGRVPVYYFAYAVIKLFHLTLCLYGSIFSCITGIYLLPLSARRLSRMTHSNFCWRIQSHFQHLHPAECSIISSHPLTSTNDQSSDPMLHPQLHQCPSTELPLPTCCSRPDSKLKTDSISEATIFSNPEETSPAPWRVVSTEDVLPTCSFRSNLPVYLLLLHLQFLSLHSHPAAVKDCYYSHSAACKDCYFTPAAVKDCYYSQSAACKDCYFTPAAVKDCYYSHSAACKDCYSNSAACKDCHSHSAALKDCHSHSAALKDCHSHSAACKDCHPQHFAFCSLQGLPISTGPRHGSTTPSGYGPFTVLLFFCQQPSGCLSSSVSTGKAYNNSQHQAEFYGRICHFHLHFRTIRLLLFWVSFLIPPTVCPTPGKIPYGCDPAQDVLLLPKKKTLSFYQKTRLPSFSPQEQATYQEARHPLPPGVCPVTDYLLPGQPAESCSPPAA